MSQPSMLRWGILGPGGIAARFAQGLSHVEGCRLVSVASRDPARAKACAAEYGALRHAPDYAALAADAEVDIVYIATPHPFHAAQIRLCLEAGKHVLCEKPITTAASELRPLVDLARAKGLFLMEGLWSRFFPAWQTMRAWIDAGRIGEPRMAQASFCFRSEWNPASRLLDPALGGGAVWDVGIYTLAFATAALGTDLRNVRAVGHVGESGVDEQVAMLLGFGGGRLASLQCAVRTGTPHAAWVAGTEGRIVFGQPFWKPRQIRLERGAGEIEEDLDLPIAEPGFQYEIAHVRDLLREGRRESPVVPLGESLLWQGVMDEALAQTRAGAAPFPTC